MSYTISTRSTSYERLCEAATREAGTVKLGRRHGAWVMQVVLAPAADDAVWRAVGVLFPNIAELEAQARHLLQWVESVRPDGSGPSVHPTDVSDGSDRVEAPTPTPLSRDSESRRARRSRPPTDEFGEGRASNPW